MFELGVFSDQTVSLRGKIPGGTAACIPQQTSKPENHHDDDLPAQAPWRSSTLQQAYASTHPAMQASLCPARHPPQRRAWRCRMNQCAALKAVDCKRRILGYCCCRQCQTFSTRKLSASLNRFLVSPVRREAYCITRFLSL